MRSAAQAEGAGGRTIHRRYGTPRREGKRPGIIRTARRAYAAHRESIVSRAIASGSEKKLR